MISDELRHAIKMDAQTCEELTIGLFGGADLTAEETDELIQHATRLLQNAKLYRDARRVEEGEDGS